MNVKMNVKMDGKEFHSSKRNETQYLLPRSYATKILHKIYLNNLHNTVPMSERLSTKTFSLPQSRKFFLNI